MSRLLLAVLAASVLVITGCASQQSVTVGDLQNDTQWEIYEVHGAVMHSGTFHLPPDEHLTLGQALRRSGGVKPGNTWDDGGDPNAVHLKRLVNGAVVEYTLLAAPGGRDENMVVLPGDYIFVPKRTFSTPIPNPLPFAT